MQRGGTRDSPEEPVLRVGELTELLRALVERATATAWVEGEVGSLKWAPSGHGYFCLKDEREDAVIDCVIYRRSALRARRFLRDGARVQVRGRATVWAPRGRLQFVVDVARLAGRGALLEALERLKQQLMAEGLFDSARKRPLPRHPRVVGVVTSSSGAAFHDIRTVAFRRGGAHLVLCPAQVQGEGAVESILDAINRLERHPLLDVLIVGRGGGAFEDLMPFNDERVVRRVAEVRVPVVSAVGHEIDTSLCDLAADVRAATPSQAAELVIPDRAASLETLRRHRLELGRSLSSLLVRKQALTARLKHRLTDPRFLIADRQQYLDECFGRLTRAQNKRLFWRRQRLELAHRGLLSRHPRAVLAQARAALGPLAHRLQASMDAALAEERSSFAEAAARLESLSPLSVLSRGYAIVTSSDGRPVLSALEVARGDTLDVRLGHGALSAVVADVRENGSKRS